MEMANVRAQGKRERRASSLQKQNLIFVLPSLKPNRLFFLLFIDPLFFVLSQHFYSRYPTRAHVSVKGSSGLRFIFI